MSKTLIIAEKPSVAIDLSRVLGGFKREGDYFENDQYVLSSSVGHLLSLIAPNDPVKGKWSFNHLPVIPPQFDIVPTDKRSTDRLKMLVKLIKRKDVTELINACDAGREGELIFKYIVQYAGVKKPVKRLWLQSMTPTSIREAFTNLRSDDALKPLEQAARSRAEADWLVGINGTRAMTAFNSKDGGFFKTPVGRVQTPTLAIVAEREERIRTFVPQNYWEVHATFIAAAGIYEAKWFDPKFKKDPLDPEKRDSRLWGEPAAKTIQAACRQQPGRVTDESKPATQLSPLLYDLTSLQREANGRFGFSAKATLSLAQSLYERHKALTYPRTDSRYLPEDYVATVQETMSAIAGGHETVAREVAIHAAKVIKEKWVKPNRRIFDNKKVSDHFAIIPTLQVPKDLSEPEAKLYDLVLKRFLAVFFPAAEFRVTTRITEVQSYTFRTDGKVLVNPGWMAVYGRDAQQDEATLVVVAEGETVRTEKVESVALATKPPPRYSEATLLSAMEGAGKLVDDEELREAMSERGLGTPATRASIIEGLITETYLRREGRELVATAKAKQLMTLLSGLDVKELTSPELTGEWEHKLKQIEHGTLEREKFMQEIAQITQVIVKRAKEYDRDTIPGDYVTLTTPCPKCGKVVKENYRRFACTACDFSISKHPGGRTFEPAEVEELLRERQIGPMQGFISKLGRPFAAILRIDGDHKLEFDFGQRDEDNLEPVDFSQSVSLGACPKCGSRVFEHGMSFLCEKSVGSEKSCDFKSGKVILQQEISPDQMTKLLEVGRTDLLEGFISSRTRRKFKAYLSRGADGKVSFEFEPRPEKKGKVPTKSLVSLKKTVESADKKVVAKKAIKKAVKKAATKTAVKKTAVLKTATKKTAVKKAAVKKVAAKKTTTKKVAAQNPQSSASRDSDGKLD
jgi:DNA topoisomerase-3